MEKGREEACAPHLHVVATPIGNLGDISRRAEDAFRRATLVACEDTRRTWALLSHLGIPRPRMISYRQGNEERVSGQVLAHVAGGGEAVLCSDGGYPAVSDPGYRLLRRCAEEGVAYDVVPGPSAVAVALLSSALPTDSFTFLGFPPRGPGALRRWFAREAASPHTLICFESPYRIAATLAAALEVLGDREAAVCTELTKLHERVERGPLSALAAKFAASPARGEVAFAVAGDNPRFAAKAAAARARRGTAELWYNPPHDEDV